MSVSTIAGEIRFAVIPNPARCDPYECVSPKISSFDAAYCAPTTPPALAAIEEMKINRPHLWRGIAGTTADVTKKRRAQIKMDRPVERREISIVEPLVSCDASAVHQDVDLTVLTGDRPGQQVDLFRVGDIRTDRDAPPSAFRDRRDNFIRREFVFPIVHGEMVPALGKGDRNRTPMPQLPHVTRAIFSVEIHGATISCSVIFQRRMPSNFVHKTRTLRLVRVGRAGNSRR